MAILGFHGPRDFLQERAERRGKALARPLRCRPAGRPAGAPSPQPARVAGGAAQGAAGRRVLAAGRKPAAAGAAGPARQHAERQARRRAEGACQGAASRPAPTPYSPWGLRLDGKPALTKLDAFTRGAIEVQDEGSQLLALLLDAKRGEMVVDFCAGAGGKTLAIGATMRNTGRLYAFDTSAHRLDALKPRLARSKLSNVHPAAIAHERDDRIKRLAGKIDRVLVDAPCSGLGTLRRNPDLKWRQSPKSVEELTAKQTAILQSAARLRQAGRPAGLRHLQPAAGGKRSHRRGFRRSQSGFRAAGRRRSAGRPEGRRMPRRLCSGRRRRHATTCVCGRTGTRPTAFLPPSGTKVRHRTPKHGECLWSYQGFSPISEGLSP